MSEKSQRGGPREGAGRKTNLEKGLPRTTWQDYERVSIPRPVNDREADALDWFKNLEPFERLQLIVKVYYSP
jgi:hypothetical protein